MKKINPYQSFIKTLPQNIPEISEVYFYSIIDSTQSKAIKLGKSGKPNGVLVVADSQTQGRGRLERCWESPAGKGIYFSLLLRMQLDSRITPLLTLAVGLALKTSLEKLGIPSLMQKWPNDILINGKKVAGILSEMFTLQSQLDFVVIGVGINVYQKPQDFSSELQNLATSLATVKKGISREEVMLEFLPRLFSEIQLLAEQGAMALINRWNENSGMLGAKVIEAESHRSGVVLGLSEQGYLRLQADSGEVFEVIAGDIEIKGAECGVRSAS